MSSLPTQELVYGRAEDPSLRTAMRNCKAVEEFWQEAVHLIGRWEKIKKQIEYVAADLSWPTV